MKRGICTIVTKNELKNNLQNVDKVYKVYIKHTHTHTISTSILCSMWRAFNR